MESAMMIEQVCSRNSSSRNIFHRTKRRISSAGAKKIKLGRSNHLKNSKMTVLNTDCIYDTLVVLLGHY